MKEADVFTHGANCLSTMGAGIAKIVSEKFPEMVVADNRDELAFK